jgi:CRP-like cAMP-binding protein
VDLPNSTGLAATASLAAKFRALGIESDELNDLVRFVKNLSSIAAGSDIVRAGERPRCSTIVLAGIACQYRRRDDGSRQIYSFHHPGDFCDLYRYVLPELDESVAVQAITDCSVAKIDHTDIERLLSSKPKLGLALWRATMLASRIVRERLLNIGRGTALQRVATLLCEQLALRKAIGIESSALPFSQIDIADATSLSVVHVNRVIQTLRGLNVVSKASQPIEVIDSKLLAQVAGFDGRYLDVSGVISNWAAEVNDARSALSSIGAALANGLLLARIGNPIIEALF